MHVINAMLCMEDITTSTLVRTSLHLTVATLAILIVLQLFPGIILAY